MNYWDLKEGRPFPFGQTRVGDDLNFALYSKTATSVTLHLFSADDLVTPVASVTLDRFVNKTERIWHCAIPLEEVPSASYYGYQVDGPSDPGSGDRFDREKLLLDPWAETVHFPPGFSREAASRPGRNWGQAPVAGIERDPGHFDWGDDARPHHDHELVIYEMHVRGFTRRENSGVGEDRRGTFAGVIDKIPYLKELGVTAVELMPVHQFDPKEGNYWGYMTLNFFAPHNLYSSVPTAPADEFRQMVKALHAADIEVILDVVYNHTTEGDAGGPNYSFRGLDNSTYYLLTPDLREYRNDAGTGNVMRTANQQTRKLILDSLTHWARDMRVDGFRFDLASIFTRDDDGDIDLVDPPIVSQITSDTSLAPVRLIGEVWDLATYQLGRAFPGFNWGQWNGKFRDDIRGFVKSDNDLVATLMTRLYGSSDLYSDELPYSYRPFQSINYVASHDGFTLYDLVSYNQKHNEGNGHQNTDGPNDNHSWNCGWEGEEGVPEEVMTLRRRQVKNFCSLLMLANGTPMFCMGDEFMNTQQGNNNPYNRDDETTWLDWDRLEANRDIFRFFRAMIAFRKAHPSIARGRFWRDSVSWYGVQGGPDLSSGSHTLAYCLHGASEGDADLYVMINAYWEPLDFAVQEGGPNSWKRVVDTALPSPDDVVDESLAPLLGATSYTVQPRSIVVLAEA